METATSFCTRDQVLNEWMLSNLSIIHQAHDGNIDVFCWLKIMRSAFTGCTGNQITRSMWCEYLPWCSGIDLYVICMLHAVCSACEDLLIIIYECAVTDFFLAWIFCKQQAAVNVAIISFFIAIHGKQLFWQHGGSILIQWTQMLWVLTQWKEQLMLMVRCAVTELWELNGVCLRGWPRSVCIFLSSCKYLALI